jgi:hypothetical protein
MSRIAALVIVFITLVGCDAISTLVDGVKYASAVENDLAASTGMKPQVGFAWHNGRLTTVTVTFPRLYAAKPLDQLADMVRRSVASEFKQTPDDIVLGFSLGQAPSGAAAQWRAPPQDARAEL